MCISLLRTIIWHGYIVHNATKVLVTFAFKIIVKHFLDKSLPISNSGNKSKLARNISRQGYIKKAAREDTEANMDTREIRRIWRYRKEENKECFEREKKKRKDERN